MANGTEDVPTVRDLWEQQNQARLEVAEIKGMIKMHFSDNTHHVPPCKAATDLQKAILSAMTAAVLALVSAVGSIIAAFIRN